MCILFMTLGPFLLQNTQLCFRRHFVSVEVEQVLNCETGGPGDAMDLLHTS